jgi:hypothetical protein
MNGMQPSPPQRRRPPKEPRTESSATPDAEAHKFFRAPHRSTYLIEIYD